MKKILIAYDTMMTGGTTTALLSLLNELDFSDLSVDLILFRNEGPFLKELPKDVNLLNQAYIESGRVLSVSKEKIIRTIFNGNAIRSFLSYLKYKNTPKGNLRTILMHYGIQSQVDMSRAIDNEYDVAIGFIEGWADQYILSDKIRAKSKIVWIHPDYKESYLVPEIDRKLFKKASNIIVVAKSCEANICSFFPEQANKIRTIENITSTTFLVKRADEKTPKIKKAKFNFCTVARCDMDVKGLDRILLALRKLKNDGNSDFLWHYIGDGRDYQQLNDNIRKFGLQKNVICYGQMNNPLVILKQMDFFVLASRYEGKPVSVTEAMALRVPCIVTAYASAHEQVANGNNGIVTENSDLGIYKALVSVMKKPELKILYRSNIKDISNKEEVKKLYELL